MKRRTFLKSIIAAIAITGLPADKIQATSGLQAVKIQAAKIFVAKSPVANIWSKTIFENALQNMYLPMALMDEKRGIKVKKLGDHIIFDL